MECGRRHKARKSQKLCFLDCDATFDDYTNSCDGNIGRCSYEDYDVDYNVDDTTMKTTTKKTTTKKTTTKETTTQKTTTKKTTTKETTKETTTGQADDQCDNVCEDCPAMQWKGGRYSKLMYEAENAFVLKMNVPNTAVSHNIREVDEYAGFVIFSRRWCGVELLDKLMDGEVLLSVTDYSAMYEVVDMYERKNKDDKNRDSVTIQYRQERKNADNDLPNSMKKDQFVMLLVSADPIAIKNKDKCFKIMTGVLPENYNTKDPWAKCAGDQKDVGY